MYVHVYMVVHVSLQLPVDLLRTLQSLKQCLLTSTLPGALLRLTIIMDPSLATPSCALASPLSLSLPPPQPTSLLTSSPSPTTPALSLPVMQRETDLLQSLLPPPFKLVCVCVCVCVCGDCLHPLPPQLQVLLLKISHTL